MNKRDQAQGIVVAIAEGRVPKHLCSEPGCERSARRGDLCMSHDYQKREKARVCAVPSCKRTDIKGWGLCGKHAGRFQRTGSVDSQHRKTCEVEGCGAKHKAHGYCSKHYARLRKYGNVEDSVLPRRPNLATPFCTIPGCDEKHWARGLCRNHVTVSRSLREDSMLTDDEPLLSAEPLIPVLRELAERGKDCWGVETGRHRTEDNDHPLNRNLTWLSRKLEDMSETSAKAWRRTLVRFLVGEQSRARAGDLDLICYALGTHPIFFWPEEWVPSQQGLDAA